MKIVNIKDLEDCYDGSKSKEFMLDEPTTKDFIKYLGKSGDMSYYASFAKPFYKIKYSEGGLIAKGIESANTLKITVKAPNQAQLINEFERLIEQYKMIIQE
jgi:hypothetical protein